MAREPRAIPAGRKAVQSTPKSEKQRTPPVAADRAKEQNSTPPELTKTKPVQAMRLIHQHSFIGGDFNRATYLWRSGEVVTDPAEIAFLEKRGAVMVPVETAP